MACHLTFRQPQQSRLPPLPPTLWQLPHLPLGILSSTLSLWQHTVTFAIATEQKVHIKNCSLFVARCTRRTCRTLLAAHFGIAIADLAIALISAHTA